MQWTLEGTKRENNFPFLARLNSQEKAHLEFSTKSGYRSLSLK